MTVFYWIAFAIFTITFVGIGTAHRLGGLFGVKLSRKLKSICIVAGIIALILLLMQYRFDF